MPPGHVMMDLVRIDLNADVGESFGRWTLGDDASLLEVVTSANVACGFHAGDPSILKRTCDLAAERGVAIGAQVAYRDLAGFGRRFLDVEPDVLRDDVLYQLGALDAFARAAGSRVSYVKPHGALYHAVIDDKAQAVAVVEAVLAWVRGHAGETAPAVLGLPGSQLLDAVRAAGLRAVPEAFVDRAYDQDGRLRTRGAPGALVTDPEDVARRAVRMAQHSEVVAQDGTVVLAPAESLCVHGDTPGAVAIARAVRRALVDAGVEVASFVAEAAESGRSDEAAPSGEPGPSGEPDRPADPGQPVQRVQPV
jgi:UPF0271 protein